MHTQLWFSDLDLQCKKKPNKSQQKKRKILFLSGGSQKLHEEDFYVCETAKLEPGSELSRGWILSKREKWNSWVTALRNICGTFTHLPTFRRFSDVWLLSWKLWMWLPGVAGPILASRKIIQRYNEFYKWVFIPEREMFLEELWQDSGGITNPLKTVCIYLPRTAKQSLWGRVFLLWFMSKKPQKIILKYQWCCCTQ